MVLGVDPLDDGDLAELEPYGSSTARRAGTTSVNEAEVVADGLTLGPVGGRIVAGVLSG